MKSSLNKTVLLSVMLTVIVTLSAGFYFIIQEEWTHIFKNMRGEATAFSNIIADNLSESFQRVEEEREELQTLVEEVHKFENLIFVEIFDRDGIIISHTNKDKVGSMPSPTHREYIKSVFETGEYIEKEEHDRKRVVKFSPIYIREDEQKEIVGVMELAIEMKPGMNEAIDRSNALVQLYKNIAGNILIELDNSQSSIQNMAEETGKGEKILWLEVFDKNGSIIAHTEKSRVGQRPLPIHEEYVKKVLQTGTVIEEEDFDRQRFNRFVPYFVGSKKGRSEIAGVVELVMDMKPVMAQIEALRNRMMMTTLSLMVAIVSILLFMLRKLVLLPVRELTRATRDMAEGDMDRKVDIASKNELGELGNAFNNLAANLKNAHTDLMINQKRLLEAKGKAEEASVAKSEFLASMSHEIRTPMNVILGMTEVLSEADLSPEHEKSLSILTRAGNALMHLIDDILDLSRIESGHLEMDETEFELENILAETVSVLSVVAQKKGLKLSYNIEPDVPKNIIVDPKCLLQILFNLVGNAVKFTEKGQIDINLRKIEIKNEKIELEFYIKDTGIGIPEDKLDTIFERFTQADTSTTRKYGGTGLGTAISKKFVELMGGRIWVESKLGEGSTFYFTVKLNVAKTEEGEKAVEKMLEGKSISWKQPLKILLVDDSEDNLMLMHMHLKKTPHNVDTAENGKVAVEKFQTWNYDLVLMDMEMPVMDGYTATKEIRKWEVKEKKEATPIVALTAHALKEHVQKSIDVGCIAHITKPIKKQKILEAIYKYGYKS